MWQCKWLNLVDNLRTLEVMSPDDQILIRFATNQKMHIWMKYKLDSKKYRKSDVEKYKNISNKILNWCKCRHLVTKFWTIASGAICNQSWAILAERFTQDMRSIPWVRCASGNVYIVNSGRPCILVTAVQYDHMIIFFDQPLYQYQSRWSLFSGWRSWTLTLVASPRLRWTLLLCWLS